jgi:HD-GYP domain-containing protein (c-di-GMP phosphodiesterase class II)
MNWPNNFDFNKDTVCQTIFRPFIEDELKRLEAYDQQRPDGITYVFHAHALRVATNIKKTCLHLGLGEIVANNMYWAVLPHDIGKRALPVDVWDSEEKPTAQMKDFRRSHTVTGTEIVHALFPELKHPFMELMLEIMAYHHEQMDGSGTHGLTSEKLSLPVRLAAIVEAYDGYTIWRPHFADRDISVPGVLKKMREDKGAQIYDMDLLEAFADMKMIDYNNSEKS